MKLTKDSIITTLDGTEVKVGDIENLSLNKEVGYFINVFEEKIIDGTYEDYYHKISNQTYNQLKEFVLEIE